MAWDFSTDPEFAAQLEWMRRFVDEEIEPLSLFYDDMTDASWKRAIAPLQQQVRDRGLWACHLDPELGGQGYGQVKLALSTASGAEKVVEIIGPGMTFGEALMFTDRPYLVSATALADCLLLHVGKEALYRELERDPRLARPK